VRWAEEMVRDGRQLEGAPREANDDRRRPSDVAGEEPPTSGSSRPIVTSAVADVMATFTTAERDRASTSAAVRARSRASASSTARSEACVTALLVAEASARACDVVRFTSVAKSAKIRAFAVVPAELILTLARPHPTEGSAK